MQALDLALGLRMIRLPVPRLNPKAQQPGFKGGDPTPPTAAPGRPVIGQDRLRQAEQAEKDADAIDEAVSPVAGRRFSRA